MSRYCPQCGASLRDGNRFCPTCGLRQDSTADAGTEEAAPGPESAPKTAYSQMDFSGVTGKVKTKKAGPWIAATAAVLLLLLLLFGGGSSDAPNEMTREEFVLRCEEVDYQDVARNPEEYDGRYIQFKGKVIQVSEGYTVILRIDQDSKNSRTWYVQYRPEDHESRILENDVITVYGICTGTESYRAVLGNQVTIPAVTMRYYDADAGAQKTAVQHK